MRRGGSYQKKGILVLCQARLWRSWSRQELDILLANEVLGSGHSGDTFVDCMYFFVGESTGVGLLDALCCRCWKSMQPASPTRRDTNPQRQPNGGDNLINVATSPSSLLALDGRCPLLGTAASRRTKTVSASALCLVNVRGPAESGGDQGRKRVSARKSALPCGWRQSV